MASQYADDRNLRARQRVWEAEDPPFDLFGWVLDLAPIDDAATVLDVGCGPGGYLRRLRESGVTAVGLDLSPGIMPIGEHPRLVNGDAARLPFADDSFDVVLAPHMLYHVTTPADAAREIRRVLRDGGVCVAVTNGAGHTRSIVELVEWSVRHTDPDWKLRSPSTEFFSLENGAEQLAAAFASVTLVRPEKRPRVELTEAGIVADYVASVGDSYERQISKRWASVVDDVFAAAQAIIDREGAFVVEGDPGAFVCSGHGPHGDSPD